MNFESVFVTVGTTKFDKLIECMVEDDTLKALKNRNCKKLLMQIGNGTYIPDSVMKYGILIEYYRFKDFISHDIMISDLIISHAGAGTCLEVLELGKNLITVVNDGLMNNHQTELSDKLAQSKYSYSCTCDSLASTVKTVDFTDIEKGNCNNSEKCATIIQGMFKFMNE